MRMLLVLRTCVHLREVEAKEECWADIQVTDCHRLPRTEEVPGGEKFQV